MKKIGIGICVVVCVLLGIGVMYRSSAPSPAPTVSVIQPLSYKGEEGKDALTLLQEQYAVDQASSGLVTSINGRRTGDREYWAFYINGKLATLGPKEYKTKNTDTLLWKIEIY